MKNYHLTLTQIRILFVLNIITALAMAALCALMLSAICIHPTWPLAVIALLSLIVADLARHQAINLLRQTRFWKKWLH
jgi:hypothetical protein